MTSNIEPLVCDLLNMLLQRVQKLYPNLAEREAEPARIETPLKVLAQVGLVEERRSPDGLRWSATTILSEDVNAVLTTNPLEYETFVEEVLPLDSLSSLADNEWVYEQVPGWLGGGFGIRRPISRRSDVSFEEAFNRTFRFTYMRTLLLVASLWSLKEEGKVIRREGKFGGQWSPTPYDFFTHLDDDDSSSRSLLRRLEKGGLMEQCSKSSRRRRESQSWRVTEAGIDANLTSETHHLLDVLERLDIRVDRYG